MIQRLTFKRLPGMETKEIILYGKVQGVGFRRFAKLVADQLNIKGYVKNQNDNQLDIIAQGDKNRLKEFIDLIKQGPLLAKIEKCEIKSWDSQENFQEFRIIWD